MLQSDSACIRNFIFNLIYFLIIFAKHSILDFWQGSEYVFLI